jgi:hypothetical protein
MLQHGRNSQRRESVAYTHAYAHTHAERDSHTYRKPHA